MYTIKDMDFGDGFDKKIRPPLGVSVFFFLMRLLWGGELL